MPKVLAVLRRRRQTKRFQRSVYLLPGMFTVGTLFCGYACIVYAMREDYATAAIFIGVATLLDVLDGRIARLAGAASEFGGEFDSLADVISFGVAPAVLVFRLGPRAARSAWLGCRISLYVDLHGATLGPLQHPGQQSRQAVFRRDAKPRRGGRARVDRLRLAGGFTIPQAPYVALAMVLVPALMMVSRIRFSRVLAP